MSFFILLILIGAFLQTVFRISLLPRTARITITILLIASVALFYKIAASYNLKDLTTFFENKNTLASVCFIVIVQEITALVSGAIFLRKNIVGEKLRFYNYIALLPSLLFMLGQFLLLIYVFNTISGINYFYGSLGCGAILMLTTIISCEISQLFTFEQLLKLNFSSSLIMIFLAMFLPVILTNSVPKTSYIAVNIKMLYGLIFVAAMVTALALITPIIKKIKYKFIKLILK